jgi:predicted PurR-regulated permease PerM
LAKPFLSSLAWAIALAIIVAPVHRRLLTQWKSPTVAAAMTVALLAMVASGIMSLVVPRLVNNAYDGLYSIQEKIESGELNQLLQQRAWLKNTWLEIQNRIDLGQTAHSIIGWFSAIASSLVQWSLISLLQACLALFFLFYFLRDQESVFQLIHSLSPLSFSETQELCVWITDTIHATLLGTVLVGFVQGLLGGLMFWWIGLGSPVFWGIMMGMLWMLPLIGPSLVWGPAAIILALNGHWIKALILIAWGNIAIGGIGNILYSVLLGRRLRFHTVAVFIAIIGGLFLFGSCGFFLGPVILAITMALISIRKNRMILKT